MMLSEAPDTSVSISLMGTSSRWGGKSFLVLLLLFLFHNRSISPCRWSLFFYFFSCCFSPLQVNSYLTLPLVSGEVASCVTFAQSSAVNRWALDKHQKTSDAVAFSIRQMINLGLLFPSWFHCKRTQSPLFAIITESNDGFSLSGLIVWRRLEVWDINVCHAAEELNQLNEELLTLILANTWQVEELCGLCLKLI